MITRSACLFFLSWLTVAPSQAADRVCSVIVPDDSVLGESSKGISCPEKYSCEIPNCEGWVVVDKGSVQVVYKSTDNRSRIVEVEAGDPLFLDDLQAGGTFSSAIRSLLSIFSDDERDSQPGGRFAIQPGASAGDIPSGQIAVFAEGLSFSIPDAAPEAVYVFNPQSDSSAVTRVTADDGVYRIDASLLPAGQRFRGGLEGGTTTVFLVAAQDRLERVAAELDAPAELSETAAAYQRALIYFDNGLSWNGRAELAALQSDETDQEDVP